MLAARSLAPLTLVALAVLTALALAPAGQAQDGLRQVTVLAHDDGCPASSYCFELQGDLSGLAAGQRVELTLRNEGRTIHNLYVTTPEKAHERHSDTPAEAAIARTGDLRPGETTALELTVPEEGSALYLWCDVGGHETLGMWYDSQLGGGPEAAGEPASTPLPPVLTVFTLLGVAASLAAGRSPGPRR